MPNCVLVTFYNSRNIGDLLIADILTEDVAAAGFEVCRCSYEGTFKITNSTNRSDGAVSSNQEFSIFARYIAKARNYFVTRLKSRLFRLQYIDKIRKSDLLVIGGGNMIMDFTSETNSAGRFKRYVDIAKKYNKKVVVLSIGIGPFQTAEQRQNAIEVLNECDYVTYRDRESYLIGSEGAGATKHCVSVDPVFKLLKSDAKKDDDNLTIGIGVINTMLYDKSKEKYFRVRASYVELIRALLAENYKIVVFSSERADYCMVDEVVDLCSSSRVSKAEVKTREDLLELYTRELSYVVAARMHSLIIAFTQGIPIIGLSWQRKVSSMFKLIESEEKCIQIDDMRNNIPRMTALIRKEINNEDSVRMLSSISERVRDMYGENLAILDELYENYRIHKM